VKIMSSTPKTPPAAIETAGPFEDTSDEFALGSLPEAFEQAAATARTLVATEADALAELMALSDALLPQQGDTPITAALQTLRTAVGQAAVETRDLLSALETLASDAEHLPGVSAAEAQFAMKLVEAARRYGNEDAALALDAGTGPQAVAAGTGGSAFARVIAALEALPAAMAVALEGPSEKPRAAVAASVA
jgi:hypothetical protein